MQGGSLFSLLDSFLLPTHSPMYTTPTISTLFDDNVQLSFFSCLVSTLTPDVVVYFALRITNVGNPDQMPLFVTPKHQMWGQVLPSRYVYKRQQQQ